MTETCDALVTGGAGFMGSHLADELLATGHRVAVLDDLSGGERGNVPDGCEFIRGSVVERDLVEDLFAAHRFEVVYHLAAYAAEGLSHFIRRFNYTNNLIGSVTLLNAAVRAGTRRFVFTSSIAVYGAGQLPMTERMEPAPEDPYGIAKRAFELDLAAAGRLFGLEHVTFRPHNVYGERQNIADPYRNVVGIFINKAMRGEPMPVFGDGRQTRAFTYVGDVTPVIAEAGFRPEAAGRTFNVGCDEPVSVLELAGLVADAFGVEPDVVHLPARHEVKHAFSDHSAVREVFGERPATPLAEGVRRMARWARRQPPREPRPFTGIELRRGLPPSWAALTDEAAPQEA